ncbi:hypothetical protein C8J56DRAFT_898565 [Mycena floridula]|nr:hypothetical protein C8J56DRAFT_898565 [Mycena floridula]
MSSITSKSSVLPPSISASISFPSESFQEQCLWDSESKEPTGIKPPSMGEIILVALPGALKDHDDEIHLSFDLPNAETLPGFHPFLVALSDINNVDRRLLLTGCLMRAFSGRKIDPNAPPKLLKPSDEFLSRCIPIGPCSQVSSAAAPAAFGKPITANNLTFVRPTFVVPQVLKNLDVGMNPFMRFIPPATVNGDDLMRLVNYTSEISNMITFGIESRIPQGTFSLFDLHQTHWTYTHNARVSKSGIHGSSRASFSPPTSINSNSRRSQGSRSGSGGGAGAGGSPRNANGESGQGGRGGGRGRGGGGSRDGGSRGRGRGQGAAEGVEDVRAYDPDPDMNAPPYADDSEDGDGDDDALLTPPGKSSHSLEPKLLELQADPVPTVKRIDDWRVLVSHPCDAFIS